MVSSLFQHRCSSLQQCSFWCWYWSNLLG